MQRENREAPDHTPPGVGHQNESVATTVRPNDPGAAALRRIGPISIPWRLWLLFEMLVLYVGAPLLLYVMVFGYKIPLFQLLPPIGLAFLLILAFDRNFSWWQLLFQHIHFRDLASMLGMFLVAAPAIAAFAYAENPGQFFRFPRVAWDAYVLIMIGYPVISVTVQELLFRVLYFQRYAPFFGTTETGRLLAICVGAIFFAFAHVIFDNWPSIWISLVGGIVLGARYERTRSFWLVWLEHSLYGNLIFTVGLGRYFYTGVSNLG